MTDRLQQLLDLRDQRATASAGQFEILVAATADGGTFSAPGVLSALAHLGRSPDEFVAAVKAETQRREVTALAGQLPAFEAELAEVRATIATARDREEELTFLLKAARFAAGMLSRPAPPPPPADPATADTLPPADAAA